ncbi:hypothetical protein ACT453_35965, partial [Bacillus sp. D-CC]
LEQDKLHAEYTEILGQIAELTAILNDFNLLMGVIREELAQVFQQFRYDVHRHIVVKLVPTLRE